MSICILDTETISVGVPFCYNIGYKIMDTSKGFCLGSNELVARDFLVAETYLNKMLFETAYYATKKPLYEKKLKKGVITANSWVDIVKNMQEDFTKYNVTSCYAYHSAFDSRVLDYNAQYFDTVNPIADLPMYDIRGYAHKKIAFTQEYQDFCDEYSLYTDSGNYSTTAESIYRFLIADPTYNEEHTALADCIIEYDILVECIKKGCELDKAYKVYSSVVGKNPKELHIKQGDNTFHFTYTKKIQRGDTIYLH